MMRIGIAAISAALAGILLLPSGSAQAQTAPSGIRLAQAVNDDPAERRRPVRRIPVYPRIRSEPDGVYPRYNPGPNAVRECNATYVEEYRPSGTVIVPRMNCYWRRG